ncbi:putative negative regulator of RcsB-dependent stress response [Bisgaardia hudsonensis]|uniref:Ancillary SecYEG translocon subunit n=1 Tax=Bisgaardia hudsonensis TaxID=109472 RepID=A0A4R2N2Z4_9PAST|nr:YfgM family protein [Bisgaardia hudsonensis]QLB12651.1 hypothetical protein A6A11_03030 [Bisgaardia hudsonensis]TCP14195.1 putative negative regulator of RcsB-dependent stress response [Bisgaardia hudsonensis]
MAYTVEEEQEINNLKAWWQDNYKSIIITSVLTFGAVFGWRYWQDYQEKKSQALSVQYEQLISIDDTLGEEKFKQFVTDNSKTSYAVLALLERARLNVDTKEFVQAEILLTQALSQSSDDLLISISALRLAMVQYQLQKFDSALSSLDKVKGKSWDSRKLLLKGDILLAKGDNISAKSSFEEALSSASPLEKSFIQMRLNNL